MDNVLIFSEDGLTVIGCDKTYSGEIVIPEGVEHIAEQTFVSCKAISIRIPNSVTSIGDYAFSGCSRLTSVNIPNSVTSIGNWGFSDCTALTTVNIPNSVTNNFQYFGVFNNRA